MTDVEFSEYFRATHGDVSRFVSRRISWDVDDVIEEIYAAAWRRRSELPDSAEDVRIWLYATGRRIIANKLRWRARLDRFNSLSAPLLEQPNGVTSTLDSKVHDALMKLHSEQREALMLVEWEGLTVTDAAKVLAVTPSTLTKRLHAAREFFARNYSSVDNTEK